MLKEKCANNQHDWFCVQPSGSLGEIKVKYRLSPDELGLVLDNPAQVEEVCPEGIIICNACKQPFFEGQDLEGDLPDFNDFLQRLQR